MTGHMTWVQGSSGGVRQWRVNSQAVERCVADVVKISKELNSDESRYFQAVSRAFLIYFVFTVTFE